MTDNTMDININNQNTSLNCRDKKIKINPKKVKVPTPSKCSINKVGDKLVELCDGKSTCQINNNILECPGYDIGINYGCMNDIGQELTGMEKKASDQMSENVDLVKNQEELPSTIIMSEQAEEPESELETETAVYQNHKTPTQHAKDVVTNFYNEYKFWIILAIVIVVLIIIGIVVYYFIKSKSESVTSSPLKVEEIPAPVSTPSTPAILKTKLAVQEAK
jgi:hypothetical protein